MPPLPTLAAQRTRDHYRPRLSLEGIGSPYFSAGGGPLGSYVSGGASLRFGDLLGDHQLLTAAHISSRLDESAVGAMYVNRRSRWNWGVSVEQTPDLRVRTTGAELDPTRENAVTRTRERMLWTNRRLGGFAAYPISRSRRVEIHGAVRELGFSRDLRTEHGVDTIGHGVRRRNAAARQRAVNWHRRGRTGAGRRLRHFRRDGTARRQPLPAAGDRQHRRPEIRKRPRRLPYIRDAGAPVHRRAPRRAHGAVRRRRQRFQAAGRVRRRADPGARLWPARGAGVRVPVRQRRLPRPEPPARQPRRRCQARGAGAAMERADCALPVCVMVRCRSMPSRSPMPAPGGAGNSDSVRTTRAAASCAASASACAATYSG